MKIRQSPDFLKKLKGLNVRLRKCFKKSILIFSKNPLDSRLDNHLLCDEWEGYRSINVGDPKNDWRAVYEEVIEDNESIARFVAIGTHKELFQDE